MSHGDLKPDNLGWKVTGHGADAGAGDARARVLQVFDLDQAELQRATLQMGDFGLPQINQRIKDGWNGDIERVLLMFFTLLSSMKKGHLVATLMDNIGQVTHSPNPTLYATLYEAIFKNHK